MERKPLKKQISKGERLGWSSIEEAQKVRPSSMIIRGRRLTMRSVQPEQPTQTRYIVP